MVESRWVQNDEVLCQYGNSENLYEGRAFKNRPNSPVGLSLWVGQLSADEACMVVCRGALRSGRMVRFTTAGELRERGFTVNHTPGANPIAEAKGYEHVTVTVEGYDEWTQDIRDEFDASFWA